MDLSTLLDRTNAAIDTIIRCDEHTQTGEYLRPCIEGIFYFNQRSHQIEKVEGFDFCSSPFK